MGASGLVGGRLVAALSRDGAMRVRAGSRIARPWPAGVEGIITDSGASETLASACEGVEVVVNLASMPEAACAADPKGALLVNAGGAMTLVRAAMTAGVTRFVQLSTAKVYGNNPTGVITEETITHPASHYAITHRIAEDYATLHPDAVVMRLANGFGAPVAAGAQSWDIIVNDFCRQAATTGRIVIRSDGLAWRNFIALDDVIIALRAGLVGLPKGTYNIGARTSTTIRRMAERVAEGCEGTLGFRAHVCVGVSAETVGPVPLDYRTDRLRNAGVSLGDSSDGEIARTLLAARELFPRVFA